MSMQDWFSALADHATSLLTGDEVYTATCRAEESDFIRFNQGKVRQAGAVQQRYLSLDLIEGMRHAAGTIALGGDLESDKQRLAGLIGRLREIRGAMPEDPYLLYATDVQNTEVVGSPKTPEPEAALSEIQSAAQGRDLVGIYAAGGIHAGFANSLGQRNWFSAHSHHFDWSFYHQQDKAVKTSYAGFEWDPARFQAKVDEASKKLAALQRPARSIDRGNYRVFLSPAAVMELVTMLSWGGFGLKALRTRQTPLLRLAEGVATMSDKVSFKENTAEGAAPNFQGAGFLRPDEISLIENGKHAGSLISPRSAKEYGVETNGASDGETPESIEMAAGQLPDDKVIENLGTGLYVGNLWYLNFSDRMACKTTGMTRFATFWVEDGEVQAPVNVMRFDESLFRMLGDNLVGLTQDRDWILDAGTYGGRETSSARLPGALIEDFAFTL